MVLCGTAAALTLMLLKVQNVVTQFTDAAASSRVGGSIHLTLNTQFTSHSFHLGLLLLRVATAAAGAMWRCCATAAAAQTSKSGDAIKSCSTAAACRRCFWCDAALLVRCPCCCSKFKRW
jgi:hypothetical protein